MAVFDFIVDLFQCVSSTFVMFYGAFGNRPLLESVASGDGAG